MAMQDPSFSIGVEEEYFLVDPESRDLASDPPKALLAEAKERLGDRVAPEFLKSQLEIGTKVCHSMSDLRNELIELRTTLRDIAAKHGLSLIAASTHPFASWEKQRHTDRQRYAQIANDLQTVVRRLVICGMHVHVGIEDDDLRVDLMGQIVYFLPHLLALSTSSPFWRGENTGLKSYRLSVFKELPRTGIPSDFGSYGEYIRHVNALVETGIIEDGSKLWWDVRPSVRYPTLEMRMTDICTRLEDTLTIAALYRCMLSMLYRARRKNQRWRLYSHMLIDENKWRAQRYGLEEGLIDFGQWKVIPYEELLDELLTMIAPDADRLGCLIEVMHARTILQRGTSADQQITIYQKAMAMGKEHHAALQDVVDWLIEESQVGL